MLANQQHHGHTTTVHVNYISLHYISYNEALALPCDNTTRMFVQCRLPSTQRILGQLLKTVNVCCCLCDFGNVCVICETFTEVYMMGFNK